jgi:photosynthetic reaction center H subunit
MQTVGNITGYIDLAQILLYVFWIFFAGLIWYLVMENHREGYPMESGSSGRAVIKGFPIPEPKTFLLEGGRSAVGAGAYSNREDVPERTTHGVPLIQPLRIASDFSVAPQDVDPRGLPVMAGDGKQGGTVKDIWIDSAEMMFRYLEVEITGGKTVLLPITFSLIRRNQVEVHAIYARHFAAVPALKNPDQVTKLEEEKITAYYGGGTLYADVKRSEPLI